ncbi:hypothetical protein P3S68_011681 [Capsicum galapagoense]
MNNLERSWMYERLDGRGGLYSRFITGVDEFIQFACSQPNHMSGDKVRCPCAKCQNYKFMDVETIKCHLYQSGFIENYFIWKHQGERDDISETSYGNAFHGVVSRMLNIKIESNMSQRGYNKIMQLLKESLPEDNIVLDNYYQTKKLVRSLGLPVEKIDYCESGCMLYWGDDDEHLTSCKFCSKPRLYASHATTADIRWHHEHKKEDGMMRHPSDSEAWKHFNESHPFFAVEPTNVRLGLCTDGFQPFSQSGRKYSSWPVIVTPYNLPPRMFMKKAYMFLTIIVPGPSNPKHKIDVYLQPLIKDLTLLWETG